MAYLKLALIKETCTLKLNFLTKYIGFLKVVNIYTGKKNYLHNEHYQDKSRKTVEYNKNIV